MKRIPYVPFGGKVGEGTIIYEPVTIVEAGHLIIIGKNCRIGQYTFIAARRFEMQDGAQIGPYGVIGGGGNVTLKKYSGVGFGTKLFPATATTEGECMSDAVQEKVKMVRGSITLGEGAWVGAGAVVCVSKKCRHIKIGDYSVVGALSYIDESVDAYTMILPKKEYEIKKRRKPI